MLHDFYRNFSTIVKRDEACGSKGASKSVMFAGLKEDEFSSIFPKSNIAGPNVGLAKGPKDALLL